MTRFILTSAMVCLLAASSSQAFAPSFVAHRQTLSRTFGVAPSITTSTALQMNLFDRFSRVAKSNLNGILQKLEDPEKIMTQALEDMQGDLVKVRQSYAEVTATQRRQLKQKEQCDSLANDWYERAQLALQKGNDELAKEALTRRQQQTEQAGELQQQIDNQAASIDKLYEGMQMLEKKILESKSKKDQMVARARTASSTQKVNDMLGGITGKTSMDAFSRMEEKVESLEAAAEVSAEMGSMAGNGNMLPGTSSVEAQFKALEAGSAVDDELAKMKGLLGGSNDAAAAAAAPTKPAAASDPEVDDELAKMKREAGL